MHLKQLKQIFFHIFIFFNHFIIFYFFSGLFLFSFYHVQTRKAYLCVRGIVVKQSSLYVKGRLGIPMLNVNVGDF